MSTTVIEAEIRATVTQLLDKGADRQTVVEKLGLIITEVLDNIDE